MSGGEEEETTLEFTPAWVVAAICTVIVAISLAVERLIHYTEKCLKRKNEKTLFEALLKIIKVDLNPKSINSEKPTTKILPSQLARPADTSSQRYGTH